MSFVILLIGLMIQNAVLAGNVIILEKASNCAPNSKIVLNYTYTHETNKGVGYVEFLEKIEPNSNHQLSASVLYRHHRMLWLNSPTIRIAKTDFCEFFNTDSKFLPYIRDFINLGKSCPINKGSYGFLKSSTSPKNNKEIPAGCLKLNIRINKNGKMFACIRLSLRMTPPTDSEGNYKCEI